MGVGVQREGASFDQIPEVTCRQVRAHQFAVESWELEFSRRPQFPAEETERLPHVVGVLFQFRADGELGCVDGESERRAGDRMDEHGGVRESVFGGVERRLEFRRPFDGGVLLLPLSFEEVGDGCADAGDVGDEAMVIVQHSEETLDAFDVSRRRIFADGADFLFQRHDAISVESVQRFLGMLNYYHRFVPDVAGICTPLSAILKGKRKKKNATIEWTDEHQAAFDAAKNGLANATMLVHPIANAPLALTVDASQFAVGAKLEQNVNGTWQPLGFFSRKLRTPTELKFPAFDRELMGAHLATRHFRYLIEGRAFSLYTDQD